MINVGFLLNFTLEYKGGINYIKNLFHAVHKYHNEDVNLVLFVPYDLDPEYVNLFSPNAKIVRTKILQRKTLLWFLSRITEKYIGFDPFVYYLLKNNNINCISHSNYVYPFNSIKTINWIPDFQYLHYPKLWKEKELTYVKKQHGNWVKKSDLIVVSSFAARKDLLTQYPNSGEKVEVLHFVSQPEQRIDDQVYVSKYAQGKYFYLPNQFWLHKNHLIVFKAIKVLKDEGLEVHLITTGAGIDYRDNGGHFKMLQQFVADHQLETNIDFLGLVPYKDVLSLMKHALVIINPSYFEGWSSTVEESKSIGKTIVLSDILVHREQNSPDGIYFNPDDENELASILKELWNKQGTTEKLIDEKSMEADLKFRTKDFSDTFYNAIMKILK